MRVHGPIRLAWWNTGLAPRGISRGNDSRYATAARVIRSLVDDEAIDFLAMGEVTAADLDACVAKGGSLGVSRRWHTPRTTVQPERANAVGLLYDPERLTIVAETLMTDSWGSRTFTTGWHLLIQATDSTETLNIVIVHWPSHVREDAASKRREMAMSLRKAFKHDRDVLIVGDFNDEPFSQSMSESLRAYRDRDLVRRHGAAYYNPFWRLLGEQQHVEHERETETRLPAGTHFYRQGEFTRWFTFDQVVVSSALIGASSWSLIEGATRVVDHDAILQTNGTMVDCFDHLPITTSLLYNPRDSNG